MAETTTETVSERASNIDWNDWRPWAGVAGATTLVGGALWWALSGDGTTTGLATTETPMDTYTPPTQANATGSGGSYETPTYSSTPTTGTVEATPAAADTTFEDSVDTANYDADDGFGVDQDPQSAEVAELNIDELEQTAERANIPDPTNREVRELIRDAANSKLGITLSPDEAAYALQNGGFSQGSMDYRVYVSLDDPSKFYVVRDPSSIV